VGVSALERDEFANLKLSTRVAAIAADDRQRRGRLNINYFVKRASELAAKCVGAGVVIVMEWGAEGMVLPPSKVTFAATKALCCRN